MENLNFGIDRNNDIKTISDSNTKCIHCRRPGQYSVLPDNRESDVEVYVCGYCFHYYRMNELSDNDRIIFTSSLQPKWISHLQKAIQTAKQSGSKEKIAQAEKLETWLFAHAKFVADSQWGTSSPVAIDAAVERTLPNKRKLVFSELGLALSESTFESSDSVTRHTSPPTNSWKEHFVQFKKLILTAEAKGQGSNNA
ncbi:hypothetical protein NPJ88_000015 [Halomonas elongata]|uniref:hypothetical protein n=1 Tax=Halomonas elongata TaxID=2746 RepID=UPI00255A9722|nr:hypothetical protein [Halomonas elongata]MDL4860706.1 hypothetical protein [Halomonas elongata]